MADVYDVAAYILKQRGPLTAMKLQKLVYYSQAWSIVWDDDAVFSEEIEAWKKKDPILRFKAWLAQSGLVFEDEVKRLEQQAEAEVAAAVTFAEAGSWEALADLERYVTMTDVPA